MENFYKGRYKGSPQERANAEYRNRNKAKSRYESYRRQARHFIRESAAEKDIEELKKLIKAREIKMNKPVSLNLSTDPIVEKMIRRSFENPEAPFDLNGTVFANLKAFYNFLMANLKQDGEFIPYLQDLLDKDAEKGNPDGNGSYELGSWETKSGHTEVINFNRQSDYDDIGEEYTYRYEF